jgi:hypothetical protein
MKKLFYLLIVLLPFWLQAQSKKPNVVFAQFGIGKAADYGPPSYTNIDFGYERIFLNRNHWRVGAQLDFGFWNNGALYNDLTIKGEKILALATVKFGIGKKQKHFIGVDGGYGFFNTASIGESAEPIPKHFHVTPWSVSYQYFATKGFYLRTGISGWQGLFLGVGTRF